MIPGVSAMCDQFYKITAKRKIHAANYTTFVYAEKHPDRVLKEHDFVYILSGSWEMYQDTEKYLLQADDIILLHAGARHYSLKPCSPGTRVMFVHFSADEEDGYRTYGKPLPEKVICLPTVIHCQKDDTVKNLFSDIINTLVSGEFEADARINALFCLLFLELHNCSNTGKYQENEVIADMIRLFQCNPDKNYTLGQLSDLFYMNPKTIDRYFHRLYQKSACCYQRDNRLEAARHFILEYPHTPLRVVAHNYGFCDEFHFSKAFKKKYGISPDMYRKHS